MNDRELLELAAKAAGLEIIKHSQDARDKAGYGYVGLYVQNRDGSFAGTGWNPLTDDSDAFRLAVKLGMGILYETQEAMGGRFVEVSYDIDDEEGTCKVVTELLGGAPCAATRRAIIQAAAEIWRQQ